MAKSISTKVFDYSIVTKDQKGKLINLVGQIKRANDAHGAAILEAGKLLASAQEIMADHGVGTFGDWIEKECKLSKQTAYNYVNAWKNFGGCPTVGQLEPSAMYALAGCEEAKKLALKMAGKGQTITQKIAKGLVKEVKEREPSTPARTPDTSHRPPKNVVDTDEPAVLAGVDPEPTAPTGDECPNCGHRHWTEDDTGLACAKCAHPHGEPLGDDDSTIDMPAWLKSKPDVDGFRVAVNALLKLLKDAPKNPGFELLHKHAGRIRLDLENAKAAIVGCVPHEYCPYCNGLANDCNPCSNRGWMNKVDYENIPQEIRREAATIPSGGGS